MNNFLETPVNLDQLLDPSPWIHQQLVEQKECTMKNCAPPPYPGTAQSPADWSSSQFQVIDQALSPPPMPSPSPGFYSSVSSCSTPLPQNCTSPSPSVWSEAETVGTLPELPELPQLKVDVNLVELDLSEAIMAAEATGSQMPVIKNELKYKIQKKRRESGLDELKVDYKDPEPEVLTDKDKERRERRRASNRRAAVKCRIKKKDAAKQTEIERQQLEQANKDLQEQVERLEKERDHYLSILKMHRGQGCLR